MDIPLALAFIAGMASFLSPCVLPLVPAYIGYMGGRATYTVAAQNSVGSAVLRRTVSARLSTFLHSVAFVLGFALVFVTIGLLSTAFISVIGRQNVSLVTGIISRAGGILIIFFGLHFMGVIPSLFRRLLAHPRSLNTPVLSIAVISAITFATIWVFEDWLPALPVIAVLTVWMVISGGFTEPSAFWVRVIEYIQGALYTDSRRQMVAQGRQGYAGSLMMGVVFSAGWTPCIGPIYGSILTLAAAGGDVGQAGVLLSSYSLGLGIPFILAALMIDSALGVLRRLQRYLRAIEFAAGAFLVLIGVLVASGELQSLSRTFANDFADFSYRLEECAIDLYEGQIALSELPGCIAGPAPSTDPTAGVSAEGSDPFAVAGIVELAAAASPAAPSAGVGLSVGSAAPDFAAVDHAGTIVSLSGLRGSVVLLNFWATWCGPCRIEMPALQRAYTQHAANGLVILGINNREDQAQIHRFRQQHRLTFPLLLDEDGAIQTMYAILAYPSTYVIDAAGIIQAVHFGVLTPAQIDQLVEQALS